MNNRLVSRKRIHFVFRQFPIRQVYGSKLGAYNQQGILVIILAFIVLFQQPYTKSVIERVLPHLQIFIITDEFSLLKLGEPSQGLLCNLCLRSLDTRYVGIFSKSNRSTSQIDREYAKFLLCKLTL